MDEPLYIWTPGKLSSELLVGRSRRKRKVSLKRLIEVTLLTEKAFLCYKHPDNMKTIHFKNRLEAIDWIADHVENEGQFEVLREQLNLNFIRTGRYFLKLEEEIGEVVMI